MITVMVFDSDNADSTVEAARYRRSPDFQFLQDSSTQGHCLPSREIISAAFTAWDSWAKTKILPLPLNSQNDPTTYMRWLYQFLDHCDKVCHEASFFVLANKFIGIGSGCVQPGDHLIMAKNAIMPIMVRRCGLYWKFCGFAAVHGVDYKEFLQRMNHEGREPLRYVLS